MKVKLSMKNEKNYRLRILEATPSILDALKDYWEKNNIDIDMYGEWDKVSVEIEGNTTYIYPNLKPKLIYFFDNYKKIPYEFTSEEWKDIDNYLKKNFDKYPDNYVLELGEGEYEELVDTIDERHKIDLAVALEIAITNILDYEEFGVKTYTITKDDIDNVNILEDNVGETVFVLDDWQEANLGGIEQEIFYNLADIIDRMDIYHNDYFYRSFEERRDEDITNGRKPPDISNGKEIEKGDWDSALLYLLNNDKFTNLLAEITTENFNELQELYNKVKDDLPMGYTNAIDYMADKLIAESIIETQSAYVMAEKDNKVYLSYYGYGDVDYVKLECDGEYEVPVNAKDVFWKDINATMQMYDENGNNEFFTIYDNYGEIIECQKRQILNDIEDIGIDEHYLNEYAFCYLGMADEYDNALDAINQELSFIDDKAKMYDFTRLSKYEFLKSYSYLGEREYDATRYVYDNLSTEKREAIDSINLADVKEYEDNLPPDIDF